MSGSPYPRRTFIKNVSLTGIGLSAFSILPACAGKSQLSGSGLNIIIILADDLSYRDLSSYGQEHFQTPNLDSLVQNGIRFNQAYSGSPECAPARASLLTGMHMGHCRIRANGSVRGQDYLLAEDITVAEMLKDAGYVTGFIGKWGVGLPGTEGVPYRQGFDYAYGFYDQGRAHGYYPDYIMENEKKIVLPENHGFNMERLYDYNRRPVDKLKGVDNNYDSNGTLIADGVADPARVSNSETLFQDAASSFIRKNRNNRFFLYYATQIPHGPVITPQLGKYKDKNWSLKHKEWAAMVTHLDTGIGRIIDLLKEEGIADNTVIFFAGDNGYSQWGYFGRERWQDDPHFRNKGPWRAGKFICMEGGVRVPFFAYCPDRIPVRESNHICALYDFPATAAEIAGVKPQHAMDGVSLTAELENRPRSQQKHDYLYWENGTFNPHGQAVRMGPWRAYRPHPAKPTELYRIEEDIACENDIAEEHPDIVGKVERIFDEAHTDSEWYINPGESEESINKKRERAEKSNSMQISIRANSTFKGKQ